MESLKKKLSQYNCNIFAFSSAEELLSSSICFDIAFLDIELDNNISGFQIVKALRNNNKKMYYFFFLLTIINMLSKDMNINLFVIF
ncbi:hypothetical protein DXA10_14950 [Firmicutes bacterium AM55-24TS]|nr:hypothetical protein DXA10_14950 [Firmicutes bacterium AM55-24TS]